MELKDKKEFLINSAFILLIVGLIYFVCKFMLAYLLPFIIGVVIAFVMQKPAKFLSKKTGLKIGTWASVLVGLTFILIAIIGVFIVIRIGVSITGLMKDIPVYMIKISNYFTGLYTAFCDRLSDLPDGALDTVKTMLNSSATHVATAVTGFFSKLATDTAKNMPAFLISSIVTVVASCYIANDFQGLVKFLHSLITKKRYNIILRIKDILINSVFKFASGYLLIMIITFFELFIGLLILKIRYAFLTAVIIAFVDILPVLGTGTVIIPWSIITIVGGDTYTGIGLLILYAVITIIRNFLEPKIIGGRIGINPLLTLLAMFIGLKLFGFLGMILFPITFIVIITFYKQEINEENCQ